MIPGFTDAFAYARLGAICYGFSPVRLGPELNFSSLYHGHDERIPIDGFAWGVRVLYEVVEQFCRSRVSV
jgi:acetylornithine deacetylase/succinyl-diaminopimelate desuccinylase-like protein